MKEQIESLEWFETPPMRWRALGFGAYVLGFLVSMTLFASSLGLFILLYGLRAKPSWWHDQRWPTIITALVGGSVAGFILRSIPPNVRVTREKIVRRTGFWQSEYVFEDCRSICCVPVRGVLLIKLEMSWPESNRAKKEISITARMADSEPIHELLGSTGLLRDCGAAF